MTVPGGARGQANLVSLALALAVVTAAAVGSVAVAGDALADAEDGPVADRAARALADRLLAPSSPTTLRRGVIDSRAVSALDSAALDALAPPVAGRAVRVRVGGRVVVERGDPTGRSVRRLVLVGNRTPRTRRVNLTRASPVPVNRSARVDVAVDRGPGAHVTTVRVDDRVVLHDAAGLDGNLTVRRRPYANGTLRFVGPAPSGTVRVTTYPVETNATTLEVTVGAG
jgi:hypothetical protein